MSKKPTVDGFIPRRMPAPDSEQQGPGFGGGFRRIPLQSEGRPAVDSAGSTHGAESRAPVSAEKGGLRRSDVDDSLREIDDQSAQEKQPDRKRGSLKSQRRKWIKRAIVALIIILLLAGAWIGFKLLVASSSVFKGDVFGLIQHKDLKMDANGRSNFLILGTSEDDPGHEASYLTDSIMVVSFDQKAKNAYMISIPRDLYVKYGMSCLSGYSGKINEYFACSDDGTDEKAEENRQAQSREFFGKIVGLDIQYSAHVNYSVMRDVVNAIGPITVNIEGSGGAPGVMDSNFDWKCKGGDARASLATMKKNCPPNGHFIDYPNGPATLDAEHALYLAQARGDAEPTYGLGRSNFDRELNQQKIMVAIKEKATSTGTLTNISKVTGLIDAIGDNLRSNIETGEVRTLVDLARDMPSSAIQSVNMIDADPALFTTTSFANSGSVVVPTDGTYDYSRIQAFIKKKLNSSPIAKEGARVVVLNGSGVAGAAQVEADKLTALGMEIEDVANAPSGSYPANIVYQLHTTKPATAQKLAKLYGAEPKKGTPPIEVSSEVDFVVIIAASNTSGELNSSSN